MAVTTEQNVGRIEEIQGVVVECVFPGKLPEINFALTVARPAIAASEDDMDIAVQHGEPLVLEVQQHLGDDRIRAVAMDSTTTPWISSIRPTFCSVVTAISISPVGSQVRRRPRRRRRFPRFPA
jgi:F0F1-type ATP synthase beta subunit